MHRKKIAVYYYAFMGGGAESVALWMLEALKDQYDITLFCVDHVDLESLNPLYATNISNSSIRVKSLLPKNLKFLSNLLISNSMNLRKIFIHLLIRYFKKHQSEYDLLISAYNATDLGRKGIQYIHWIKVIEGNAFHHRLSNFSEANLKSNISIANSLLVAKAAEEKYGVECAVIYPPVISDIPQVSWEKKENSFLCSGRLTKSKQTHKVIEILKQVREKGFDIKLYLTAGAGGDYALEYQREIEKLVAENSNWITLYQNLKYADYLQVLSQCKYGIHYKQEPFGISIAEMVKGGMIPFVRSQGGQVEIVGSENPDLLFDDEKTAVIKIVTVLENEEKQYNLLQRLEARKELFSTDKFKSEVNKIVDSYFASESNKKS